MIFAETKLRGAYIVDVQKHEDSRGFFARTWCQNEFAEYGLDASLVQSNVSFNDARGTLRGMHYQKAPHQETKLVRCTRGGVFDVAVDLRSDSSTFLQWVGVQLTPENHRMLYIPKGFAHGFQTFDDNTEVTYLVSDFYAPEAEGGLRWDDSRVGIDWPLEITEISGKDRNWPNFMEEDMRNREKHR